MPALALLLVASKITQAPEPVLWLQPSGQITLSGKAFEPALSPGTRKIKTERGATYDFSGARPGMMFQDAPALALTDSFTISSWIYPRRHNNAQILFRGDDRNALDPYTFVIHGDGTINFCLQNASGVGFAVTTEIQLKQWSHVVASWDMPARRLNLWLNGELVAFATTSVQPFSVLDKGWAPGVGIGNVQNDKGPHNQPFDGQLSDLRLTRGVWTPADLAFRKPGIPPSASTTRF
ncbi:MAG: LamG domain-containing protein [Fimbriimonadaceae bacterium]